jgi:hypothetical protein
MYKWVYAILQDAKLLHQKLPNSEYEEIGLLEFNHFDFMWAIDVKTLVNDRVLSILKSN